MGLAAYGTPRLAEAFRDVIRLTSDGRYQVNMKYFGYDCYGLDRPLSQKFLDTFGSPRKPGEPLTQHHKDLAFALQSTTEESILHIVRHLAKTYPSRNLCLAGGVALNCVANGRILAETDYQRIWIPPNPSDTARRWAAHCGTITLAAGSREVLNFSTLTTARRIRMRTSNVRYAISV